MRILDCPKCGSVNIKELNSELKETTMSNTVRIDALCLDCNHTFDFNALTSRGKKSVKRGTLRV